MDLLFPPRELLLTDPDFRQECWNARRERDDLLRRAESRKVLMDLGFKARQRDLDAAYRRSYGKHPLQWVGDDGLPVFVIAGGAFPYNPVLETFTGTNGTSPPNSNWTNGGDGGAGTLQIAATNVGAAGTAGTFVGYWNPNVFGPDMECYCTAPTLTALTNNSVVVHTRLRSPGTSGVDGYCAAFQINGGGQLQNYRTDNAVLTLIKDGGSTTISAGDKIGEEDIGNTHTIYLFHSAAWSNKGSATDTTYPGAGNAGVGLEDTQYRIDDWGAGTIPSFELYVPPRVGPHVWRR